MHKQLHGGECETVPEIDSRQPGTGPGHRSGGHLLRTACPQRCRRTPVRRGASPLALTKCTVTKLANKLLDLASAGFRCSKTQWRFIAEQPVWCRQPIAGGVGVAGHQLASQHEKARYPHDVVRLNRGEAAALPASTQGRGWHPYGVGDLLLGCADSMNEVLKRMEGQPDAHQVQNPVGLHIHGLCAGHEHGHDRAINRGGTAFARRMPGIEFDTVCGLACGEGTWMRHWNLVSHLDNPESPCGQNSRIPSSGHYRLFHPLPVRACGLPVEPSMRIRLFGDLPGRPPSSPNPIVALT